LHFTTDKLKTNCIKQAHCLVFTEALSTSFGTGINLLTNLTCCRMLSVYHSESQSQTSRESIYSDYIVDSQ